MYRARFDGSEYVERSGMQRGSEEVVVQNLGGDAVDFRGIN